MTISSDVNDEDLPTYEGMFPRTRIINGLMGHGAHNTYRLPLHGAELLEYVAGAETLGSCERDEIRRIARMLAKFEEVCELYAKGSLDQRPASDALATLLGGMP